MSRVVTRSYGQGKKRRQQIAQRIERQNASNTRTELALAESAFTSAIVDLQTRVGALETP